MIFHNDHDHMHVCGPVAEWHVGRRFGYSGDVCVDSVRLLGSWTGRDTRTGALGGGGSSQFVGFSCDDMRRGWSAVRSKTAAWLVKQI